ncbi:hypothetical protein [Parathalassolituus penaei]|uniref:Uncharacterized protein n=1 Tax=Parathalassolituus penaei TaxID=2997323 RepID=A0A9X3EAV5_9GAMM|nr:hypothetical protein [Parathalassolituus penaei]MCY0964217.1 hypothetical protein [Parathalassolituus penaei]
MNETLLALTLAYLFSTALLLLVLISARVPVMAKMALMVMALGFDFASYQGWKQSQGWAAAVAMPDKFLLHYAVIEEPDKRKNRKGAIYIWLSDLAGDKLADQPRAYRLPYDQETHAKVESAMRRAQAGNPQLGIHRRGDDLPEVKRFLNELGDKPFDIEFVAVPDPALPEK